jgi:hypothetical protein
LKSAAHSNEQVNRGRGSAGGGERGHGAEGGRRFGFLLVFRVSLHGKQLCLCYDSNTASAVCGS